MAYQNVGTPRFYISYGDWWRSLGSYVPREQTISPIETKKITGGTGGSHTWTATGAILPSSIAVTGINWFAALNHNVTSDYKFRCKHWTSGGGGQEDINDGSFDSVVNMGSDAVPQYFGFSLATWSPGWEDLGNNQVVVGLEGINAPTTIDFNVGCWIYGGYYDMPHSPDLKLTMTREMDGVKRIRTKGGADLVNHKYIKPAAWGTGDFPPGAWELYSGTSNQTLSRSGRRVWDLSFSYLQDSDVFPDVSSLTNYETSGYSAGDDVTLNTLLDGDDFYSQVIHKTNGGQLPFIFQPDKDNNNPDQFAICKFDMKSFKFEQVANSVYNIKLKIREVW